MNGENQIRRTELDSSSIKDTLMSVENQLIDSAPRNGVNMNLAGVDVEAVWQDYWGKYGEYLVWEGWVAKYPDQIDFEKLQAVPAIAEVEIQTETVNAGVDVDNASGSKHQQSKEIVKESESTDLKPLETKNMIDGTNVSHEVNDSKSSQSVTGNANGSLSNDETELNKETSEQEYINPCSPMQYLSPNFKCISGEEIISTLQKRIECSESNEEDVENCGTQSDIDNLANERTEMVNMMHSYSNTNHSQTTNYENSQVCNEQTGAPYEDNHNDNSTEEDFSKAWEELWNEHYTESYWYYYKEFADKFSKIAPSDKELPKDTEPVYEGIAVVNENGELEIVEGLTDIDIQCNTSDLEPASDISIENKGFTVQHEDDDGIVQSSTENTVYCVDNGREGDSNIVYVIQNEDGTAVDIESIASILNNVQLENQIVDAQQIVGVEKDEERKELPVNEHLGSSETNEDRHKSISERITGQLSDQGNDGVTESQSLEMCAGDDAGDEEEPVDGSKKKRKEKERGNQQKKTGSGQKSHGRSHNLGIGTCFILFYIFIV